MPRAISVYITFYYGGIISISIDHMPGPLCGYERVTPTSLRRILSYATLHGMDVTLSHAKTEPLKIANI